jgi:hypothetical protein
MPQVYEIIQSRIKGNQITIVTGGNAFLLKCRFAPIGFITKVIAQQVLGTPSAFTVDILNSNLGLTPGEINPATLPAGWQLFRVESQLSAAAGSRIESYTAFGFPYRNADGNDPTLSGTSTAGLGSGFTNGQRALYALIQPGAPGPGANSTWEFALNGFSEMSG